MKIEIEEVPIRDWDWKVIQMIDHLKAKNYMYEAVQEKLSTIKDFIVERNSSFDFEETVNFISDEWTLIGEDSKVINKALEQLKLSMEKLKRKEEKLLKKNK